MENKKKNYYKYNNNNYYHKNRHFYKKNNGNNSVGNKENVGLNVNHYNANTNNTNNVQNVNGNNNIIKNKHQNNFYKYGKQNHYFGNKKKYYHRFDKRHDNSIDNSNNNSNDSNDNILLKEYHNTSVDAVSNTYHDEKNDYELEFVPVKRKENLEISDNIVKEEKIEEDNQIETKLPVFKMALGVVILVALVFGISYSYFNYYRVVPNQADIVSGEVYVKVSPNDAVNLSLNRVYPRTNTEARSRNDNYVDFNIKAKNTSTTKVLYYTLNINNGADVSGKARINPDYLKVDLQEKVNGEYTYVREAVNLSDFNFESYVPVNTTSELTREYRLRIWVSDTVIISDTEPNATYTQSEFANLYANFNIDVESHDGTPPQEPPICKRATTLHTETCSQTSNYCAGDGYASGGTITYGNETVTQEELHTGDAFDCDVNGDGTYNATTERFYYVSDYFDTATKSFDTDYATLIYYRNFSGGSPSDEGVAYYGTSSSYDNWHGPTTAIASLPSTSTWSNVSLKTADRKILSCDIHACATMTNSTSGGTITYTTPIYEGKAARLLTLKELNAGCGAMAGTTGELKNCNFIFENTSYSNSSFATDGPRMENPVASNSGDSWFVYALARSVSNSYAYSTYYGVRPVIEIPKTKIEY